MTTDNWYDPYMELIEDCEKRSSRLSDWQLGFIDSLRRQLEQGRRPTEKQVEKLDEAWEHATARG